MSTTPGERRALLFLGTIAALGAGARLLSPTDAASVTPHSIEALQRQIEASDSIATTDRASRRQRGRKTPRTRDSTTPSYEETGRVRPLTDAELQGTRMPTATRAPSGLAPHPPTSEQLDLNTASAADLQRLPGIGPALAQRIVEHRETNGRFRALADLDAVRGIGPAMLQRLGPLVTF